MEDRLSKPFFRPCRSVSFRGMERGVSLLELILVLALIGAGVSLLLPAAQAAVDRFAVVGAREALAGRVATTRSRARSRGGASLVLDEATTTGWIEADGLVWDSAGLGVPWSVKMDLPGARTRARLRFDGLGIGRVASQSVRFTRRRAEARLVISAYGAVGRR